MSLMRRAVVRASRQALVNTSSSSTQIVRSLASDARRDPNKSLPEEFPTPFRVPPSNSSGIYTRPPKPATREEVYRYDDISKFEAPMFEQVLAFAIAFGAGAWFAWRAHEEGEVFLNLAKPWDHH